MNPVDRSRFQSLMISAAPWVRGVPDLGASDSVPTPNNESRLLHLSTSTVYIERKCFGSRVGLYPFIYQQSDRGSANLNLCGCCLTNEGYEVLSLLLRERYPIEDAMFTDVTRRLFLCDLLFLLSHNPPPPRVDSNWDRQAYGLEIPY